MDQNIGREGAKELAEAVAKNAAAAIVQKPADDLAPSSKIGVVARAEETTKTSDVEKMSFVKPSSLFGICSTPSLQRTSFSSV